MALKYIKLFESWKLMEGEDDIESFSPNTPKKFPVLQTTISNFLNDASSGANKTKLINSILQRSKQDPSSDKFDIKAGANVNVELVPTIYYDSFDSYPKGDKKYLDNAVSTAKKYLGLPDSMSDSDVTTWIRKNCLEEQTKGYNYPKYVIGGLYKVTDGGDTAIYFTVDKNYDQPKSEENILNLKISNLMFLKGKEGAYKIQDISKNCTLGMVVLLINAGISEDNFNFLEKSAESKFMAKCKGIFEGEGLTSMGNFARTVKIGGVEVKLAGGSKGDEVALYVAKDVLGSCSFDFAKSSLKEDGKDTLSKPELMKYLTDPKTKTIEIVGHTDSVGSEEVNMKLSKERAESVLKFLQSLPEFKNVKVKPTTTGMGFKEMLADDEKGKKQELAAKNRRVVIKINGVGPDYKALGL